MNTLRTLLIDCFVFYLLIAHLSSSSGGSTLFDPFQDLCPHLDLIIFPSGPFL